MTSLPFLMTSENKDSAGLCRCSILLIASLQILGAYWPQMHEPVSHRVELPWEPYQSKTLLLGWPARHCGSLCRSNLSKVDSRKSSETITQLASPASNLPPLAINKQKTLRERFVKFKMISTSQSTQKY